MKKTNPATRLLAMAILGIGALASAQEATLKVGDPAPPLKIEKWVKGTPVTKLGDGKIHVVEFWATWCGPCRTSIPHLTELAKKYEGKVTFTGVSVFESRGGPWAENTYEKVGGFVDQMGEKMAYNVAADGPEGVMGKTWMQAAQLNGIPAAFVIGKDGKIEWIGHPMIGLDKVIEELQAGTYDRQKTIAAAAKEAEDAKKFAALLKPYREAVKARNHQQIVVELDKLFATDPKLEQPLGMAKFTALTKYDEKAAYAYGRKLLDGAYKDEPGQLNSLAWTIVAPNNTLKTPDYALAVAAAQRSSALMKDEEPNILDTLALAYFKSGDKQKAIATAEKAISLAEKAGADFHAETLAEMRERLASFKKG